MSQVARSIVQSACPDCQALEARVAALEALVQDRRPQFPGDAVALIALARAADGHSWTARAMIERAQVDNTLREALENVDVTTAAELGSLCRRLRDRVIGHLRLVRGLKGETGYAWVILNV